MTGANLGVQAYLTQLQAEVDALNAQILAVISLPAEFNVPGAASARQQKLDDLTKSRDQRIIEIVRLQTGSSIVRTSPRYVRQGNGTNMPQY